MEPTTAFLPKLRTLFTGKDGLRAGWGLLVFACLFAATMGVASYAGRLLHYSSSRGAGERNPSAAIGDTAILLLATILATWIMSRIERRPNSSYGLGGHRKLSHFLAGLGWGVICLSLLVGGLWIAGYLVIEKRLLFGFDVWRYGAMWFVGFLLVGLVEEYLTRGYLLFTLSRGLASIYRSLLNRTNCDALGFWSAALVFSILFGLGHGHNPGESPIGLFSAGLAGLVFCLSLWRTGSLWWAIGFHATWDWAQSFLYGVADSGIMVQNHLLATHPSGKPILSGGATGPEGSVFMLAAMIVIALIIVLTLPGGSTRGE